MKCHNCGNNLYLENGMYVCKNCGYTTPVRTKMNVDVFICCTQITSQGSPTMDSMMAQDLYFRLKEQNISVFYSGQSLPEYPESERKAAFDLALDNARIIIITGSSKANFENIVSAYGDRLKNKAVLPVYSSMRELDIIRMPEMFPAINYDVTGSLDNICKDITDILNLLESREHTPTPKSRKRKRIKIVFVILFLISIIAGTLFTVYKFLMAPKLADAKDYETAQSLAEDEKYIEAINIYWNLGNYKDSVDLLGKIYSRYNGSYKDTNKMVDLDLSIVNKVAKIKISEYYGNKVITAKSSADVKNNIIEFEYEDSSAISGTGKIELFDNYFKLTIKSEASNKYCISSGTIEFTLDKTIDTTDSLKPEEITMKHLMSWLDKGVKKSELENMGYTLEKTYTSYPTNNLTSIMYKIDESDITVEFLVESGISADETSIFSVISSAYFLIPENIDKPCVPFEQNGIVYWPGEGIYWGNESHWDAAVVPSETKIRKSTPITFVTKASYERIGTWDELLESVFQRNVGTSIGSKDFTVDAENEESYLVSCEDGNALKFYKINKITYEAEYIAKLYPQKGQTTKDLIKSNIDLFPDFYEDEPKNNITSETTSTVFYRVRKSADDAASQIGAFDELSRAKNLADEHKDEGYEVYDNTGKLIYTP